MEVRGDLLAEERASLEHQMVGAGGGLRVFGPAVNVIPGISVGIYPFEATISQVRQ